VATAELGNVGLARAVAGSDAAAPGPLAIRIGVLGGMTATRDGEPVDLGGPRQRAVLALLVIARGDVVPADTMIDALWDGHAPPSATSALQAYVSHLRRRLEPDRGPRDRGSVLARQGPGYALRVDAEAVDAWSFERLLLKAGTAETPQVAQAVLERALALWQGPAFADHLGQQWADAESARLAGLRDVAREQLIEARLGSGESAVLVPEIEALVAADPLREQRWRLLVLALYRAHRQADALAALRRARSTLADELGVDPGPALRALETEVLAQSPSLDGPVRAAPPPVAVPVEHAAATQPSAVVAPDEMVDRDREVRVLRGALDDALGGQGRLALIHGPAGIGKSRLLQELRRLGEERGARVLAARGSQLEREFGFGAVRQLFEGLLADPARRAELLDGSAASAASVFGDVPDVTEPADRADGSFAVLHGLYWLTVNLAAERPVVLAVDDVQWCDAGSVRALAFLLKRLDGLPVLIAVTLRTGETHDDEVLLADLAQDLATVPVHPGPLGLDGAAALVRRRLGDSAHSSFIRACHRTTAGNPLLLRQLLRALEVEGVRPDASHADTVTAIGSRAVSSMMLMRLGRLPKDCVTVARAVSVLGDGAELPVVASLAALDDAAAAAAVAVLARSELVRVDHPLGFVHPLVGEAVYQDLPPGERELAHERAAHVLSRSGASPQQVAAQLMLAPRRGDPDTVRVLALAAETAAERGAADAASAYLERALAEPPSAEERGRLLLELGRLTTMIDGPKAVNALEAAYEALADPPAKAEVAIMLTRTMTFAETAGKATAFARRALAELPEELDDARQGLVALERIAAYMHGLPAEQWLVGEPEHELRGEGTGARMLAATLAWEELIRTGDRSRCLDLGRFALADGSLQRTDIGLLWVVAAFVQEMAEEDMSDFWEQSLADAHARGSLFSSLSVHLWRGYMLWHRGRLPEALGSVMTSNELSEAWGAPRVGVPYGHSFAIGILLEQGDVAGARAYLDRVWDIPRFGDGGRLVVEANAKILTAEGRYAEALEMLEVAERTSTVVSNPVWRPWRTYRAPALAGLGRVDEARALMAEEIELSRRWGAPTVLGRSLRVAAELGGDGVEAMLREAYELLGPSVARYECARTELALARVSASPSERESLLRAALGRALECGSPGLYRETAAELRGLGVDVPAEAGDVVTVSDVERRIVSRLAAGYSYRDVAQELFLTPATVERTLAHLRARLGVDHDTELPDAVAHL
jgi:DNA-binding SARP family transcriptional activator/DNA-binding CsgD family transcriptional regulator